MSEKDTTLMQRRRDVLPTTAEQLYDGFPSAVLKPMIAMNRFAIERNPIVPEDFDQSPAMMFQPAVTGSTKAYPETDIRPSETGPKDTVLILQRMGYHEFDVITHSEYVAYVLYHWKECLLPFIDEDLRRPLAQMLENSDPIPRTLMGLLHDIEKVLMPAAVTDKEVPSEKTRNEKRIKVLTS